MRRPSSLIYAEREAAWFFGELAGTVPEAGDPATIAAAATIDRWLRSIPSFHRGALSLRYVDRRWPRPIRKEFEAFASVAIRLECALHPAVGLSTEALEQASVERIQLLIERCGRRRALRESMDRGGSRSLAGRKLGRFYRRAKKHVELALGAFAHVRGDAPCVVPDGGAR